MLPEIEGRIRRGEIRAFFETVPKEIRPGSVTLAKVKDESTLDIEADFVLLMTGYLADTSLFRLSGVELRGEEELPVFNEQTMETNVPGLYVAGTAVAGSQQSYRVFIENCHIHVARIVAALTGAPPPEPPRPRDLPES